MHCAYLYVPDVSELKWRTFESLGMADCIAAVLANGHQWYSLSYSVRCTIFYYRPPFRERNFSAIERLFCEWGHNIENVHHVSHGRHAEEVLRAGGSEWELISQWPLNQCECSLCFSAAHWIFGRRICHDLICFYLWSKITYHVRPMRWMPVHVS